VNPCTRAAGHSLMEAILILSWKSMKLIVKI
jgi:hypothetical protein